MSPRPMRPRIHDLLVATVCVACLCAPLLPAVQAADENPAVVESGSSADQRVLQSGVISNPLNGTFGAGTSGAVDGSIQWDTYTTAPSGLKLVVSADREPAMRDSKNDVNVPDYGASPSAWSVSGAERRFGFSVTGDIALNRFGDGSKWRGFDGERPVEVARRTSAMPVTRTTLKLRAEFAGALAENATPTANLRATAVLNL